MHTQVNIILRKISKIGATKCQILRLKCTKFDFRWGSAPDPAVFGRPTGSLSLQPHPSSEKLLGPIIIMVTQTCLQARAATRAAIVCSLCKNAVLSLYRQAIVSYNNYLFCFSAHDLSISPIHLDCHALISSSLSQQQLSEVRYSMQTDTETETVQRSVGIC